ncbi:hypothetical protein RQP46_001273 [Phenoliferia psychrophenolica]
MTTSEKKLPTLPTETWIEILTEHGLSYHDLKRVAGVSRAFKAMIESPPLDALLFRGEPQATLPAGTKVVMHPLLDECDCIKNDIGNFELFQSIDCTGPNAWMTWKIHDLASAEDFATSPPLSIIELHSVGRQGYCFSVQRAGGIRIIDVLERIAAHWNEPMDPVILASLQQHLVNDPDLAEEEDFYGEDFSDVLKHTHLTYLNEYGVDANFWEGWKPIVINKDGIVVFEPREYAS